MRCAFTGLVLLCIATPALAEPAPGLPSETFVTTWTAMPTGRFAAPAAPSVPLKTLQAHARPAEALPARILDDAFASAADNGDRRDVAIFEMTTEWPQPRKTALMGLRTAQRAYAAALDHAQARATSEDRFVAMLDRIADGTGRSVATGPEIDDAALDRAYAAARDGRGPEDRARLETAQAAWLAYRDAFVDFAAPTAPDAARSIRAEMTTRRIGLLSR